MITRKCFVLMLFSFLFYVKGIDMMHYNVNDWVEFDYTDACGEYKHWTGEVVEVCHWGYRINTQDGYRSFRFRRMRNDKQLA